MEAPDGGWVVHGFVSSGGSFGGNSLGQEIGLGAATAIRDVAIVWPGNATESYQGLDRDASYLIREGAPGLLRRVAEPGAVP